MLHYRQKYVVVVRLDLLVYHCCHLLDRSFTILILLCIAPCFCVVAVFTVVVQSTLLGENECGCFCCCCCCCCCCCYSLSNFRLFLLFFFLDLPFCRRCRRHLMAHVPLLPMTMNLVKTTYYFSFSYLSKIVVHINSTSTRNGHRSRIY